MQDPMAVTTEDGEPRTHDHIRSPWPNEKRSHAHILLKPADLQSVMPDRTTLNAQIFTRFPQRKIFSSNCAWFLHCHLRCIQMNKKGSRAFGI
ncbi:hypothetical protein [Rhizobium leguminosarum]|uniref:hypothetical protein n=1 Tax=Rhizobium leguminosarum TaxID=384 RepID=UPI001319BEF2|nr:hypothetical protein [Rhizobium leguminosarum]